MRAITFFLGITSAGLCLLLTNCETYDPYAGGPDTILKGGGSDEVKWVVGTDGVALDGRSLKRMGDIIVQYKRLNKPEAQIIQRLAQEKFDGFVVQEMKFLERQYKPKIAKVEQEAERQIAEVKKKAASGQIALAQSQTQIQRITQQKNEKVAILNSEWRQMAVASVTRKYGSDFAIPVSAPGNKPVVALASVSRGAVAQPSFAYTLDVSPDRVASVNYQGKDYSVLKTNKTASISAP